MVLSNENQNENGSGNGSENETAAGFSVRAGSPRIPSASFARVDEAMDQLHADREARRAEDAQIPKWERAHIAVAMVEAQLLELDRLAGELAELAPDGPAHLEFHLDLWLAGRKK